jgi:TPR repeat protein
VDQNADAAVYWYHEAAQQGYPMAMFNLGFCFERGFGVERSMEGAMHWYQQAAELGHPDARRRLGLDK